MTAGRKRAFDKGQALDKAMRVFWENGYSGTSYAQLTAALGINKPSLYAAFGNKEQLFAAAMTHYMDEYSAPVFRELTAAPHTPLNKRLEAFLFGIIDNVSCPDSPKGCLFVRSSCESGGAVLPRETTESLLNMGLESELALTHVMEAERERGELTTDTPASEMAGYLLSIMYGLGVLARRGKSREELESVARLAIRSLLSGDRVPRDEAVRNEH